MRPDLPLRATSSDHGAGVLRRCPRLWHSLPGDGHRTGDSYFSCPGFSARSTPRIAANAATNHHTPLYIRPPSAGARAGVAVGGSNVGVGAGKEAVPNALLPSGTANALNFGAFVEETGARATTPVGRAAGCTAPFRPASRGTNNNPQPTTATSKNATATVAQRHASSSHRRSPGSMACNAKLPGARRRGRSATASLVARNSTRDAASLLSCFRASSTIARSRGVTSPSRYADNSSSSTPSAFSTCQAPSGCLTYKTPRRRRWFRPRHGAGTVQGDSHRRARIANQRTTESAKRTDPGESFR